MTSAELKTLRESLGLPLQWVADQVGVRLRTAQYWEQGRNAVPKDVAQMMRGVDVRLWDIVAQAVSQIKTAADKTGALPEQIDLVRYRTDADLWRYQPNFAPLPATCHGMMLSRLMHAIEPVGVAVRIIYMQPEAYDMWLDKRADSAAMRAQWAAEQN